MERDAVAEPCRRRTLCRQRDPSLGIRRKTPAQRPAVWLHDEVVRLVKRAVRMAYHGLAAALVVLWDSQLSLVDVVSLSKAKLVRDESGPLFAIERTKSGAPALATLSPRARIFLRYLRRLPFDLHPEAPFFYTRGARPGARGGRPWLPVPYTVDEFGKDFAVVRAAEFPGDRR